MEQLENSLFQPPRLPATSSVRAGELHDLPLFDDVSKDLVEDLASRFSRREYRAGSVLMLQGDPVQTVQILVSGFVELTKDDAALTFGVLLLSAKDLIMPAAAIFEEPTLVTVKALTTIKVFEIDSAALRAAIERSSTLGFNMMKAMSGQWRMAVRNILDLNCRNAAQRFGAFLLRIADVQADTVAPTLPMSKRSLASRLGTTPETLSRVLQTVAHHGLYLRGRSIIVQNRAKIEGFCGPDPYPIRDERDLRVYAL